MSWTYRIKGDMPPKNSKTAKTVTINKQKEIVPKQLTIVKATLNGLTLHLSIYWYDGHYYFPWPDAEQHIDESEVDITVTKSLWILPFEAARPRSELLMPYYVVSKLLPLEDVRASLRPRRTYGDNSTDDSDSSSCYDHDDDEFIYAKNDNELCEKVKQRNQRTQHKMFGVVGTARFNQLMVTTRDEAEELEEAEANFQQQKKRTGATEPSKSKRAKLILD